MNEGLALSGQIDPLSFPFLLMDLHHQAATGSLRVDGPTYQKALYFRGGRILFGSSNDPRDQLGAILIESGVLTPEQYEEASSKVGPGSPLAKVLAETGFVSQRELSEAAAAKVERILSEVLSYASGSFEFEDGVLPKGAVDLKLSTERLVVAAVRRQADRTFVLRHLGGLDVVLVPVKERQEHLPQAEAWAWDVLGQFDGQRTLKEAAAGTRLDEFEVAKIACALLFLGIVHRQDGTDPAEAPPMAILDDQAEIDLSETVRAALTVPAPPPTPREPVRPSAAPPVVASPAPAPRPLTVEEAFPIPEPEMAPPTHEPDPEPPPPILSPEPAPFPAAVPEPPPPIPAIVAPPPRLAPPEPPALRPASAPLSGFGVPPLAPPEPPPPRVASKPGRDDLAALDILLNPKGEDPFVPLERLPGEVPHRAAPTFGAPAQGRRRHPSNLRWLVPAVLALGLVAGAAWWLLGRGASATAEVTSPPAATLPPAVPPSLGTAPTAPPPPPASTLPRETAPVSSRAAGQDALPSARNHLRQGDLPQSARDFAAHVRAAPAGTATVQLLVACAPETVEKAVANTGAAELLILPVDFRGRSCYRLCWGLYPSEGRAASALGSVPDYFRRGGATPKVMSTAGLVP